MFNIKSLLTSRLGPTGLTLFALGVLGAALMARVGLRGSIPGVDEYEEPATTAAGLREILAAGAAIRPLHPPKTAPQPGEWLDQHPEAGQTFAAYRKESPNHPTKRRTTLYLQPIGELDASQRGLVDRTEEMLGLFYGVPVRRLEPIGVDAVPERGRRPRVGRADQIRTPFILDLLVRRRPDDAVAVLGLTTADLTPGDDWNYVFGQASLDQRVGVWSVYRFGDATTEGPVVLRRTLQTALHETGHMMGIRHCKAYECGMNGSNHLEEADSRPTGFCAECEMKVWWACPVQPIERYGRLAAFAHQHGLEREAKQWTASAEAIRAARAGR